jgi:hypothetical protein
LLLVENEPKDIQIAADAAGLFRQLIGNDTPFHLNGTGAIALNLPSTEELSSFR